jgi:DNA-binding MarR family transcriptional regulator
MSQHSEGTTQSRQTPVSRLEMLNAIVELSTRLVAAMNGDLADRGITRSRAEILWRLARLGPSTQRRLSVELSCTPRNVTDLVDALERAGLVSRERHPTDRRATLVTLTDLGAAKEAEIRSSYRRRANQLFHGIDPVDLGTFGRAVDGVVLRLQGSSKALNSRPVGRGQGSRRGAV